MSGPKPPEGAIERELDRRERDLIKAYGATGAKNAKRLAAARVELAALRKERDEAVEALKSICGEDTVIGHPMGVSRRDMIRIAREAIPRTETQP
ncbi:MAG: hypothetical protein VW239_02080 [Candidatus Nanopelagicales bacterium]